MRNTFKSVVLLAGMVSAGWVLAAESTESEIGIDVI